MPTTPSPLRYPGGKTKYAEMLRWIIENNNLSGCSYAEPFAGGAGAAISLLLGNHVKDIWLNDFDKAIYSFWKAMLSNTDEFIAKIRSTRISIPEWKRQKQIYLEKGDNCFDLGFATFYLNRCNRAGILLANPVGGMKQDGADRMDARFNKRGLIEKITKIAVKRDRIKVFNDDALDFVFKINKSRESVLVYFDPPYYQKGELLYLNHYKPEDHQALRDSILSCRHSWILSYDDKPEILELYSSVPSYRRSLQYSISTPSKGSELIVSHLHVPGCLEAV